MSKRDFNDFQPTRIDRRLGAVLVAAMVGVLVGAGVEATQGPALAGAAPAPATASVATPSGTVAAAAAPTLVVQTALATAAAGR